jgi:hypothetical protein
VTRPAWGTAGPEGRPGCWNGEPMREYPSAEGPIPWFGLDSRCKSWAGNPGSDPVPLMEGWRCHGCRFFPEELVGEALKAAARRQERRVGGAQG